MYDQDCDGIIEIDPAVARIHVLTPEAQDWIEAHVTLGQVQTWTGSVLEVAPHDIGELIAGMLADGLQLTTARDHLIESRARCDGALFMTVLSLN